MSTETATKESPILVEKNGYIKTISINNPKAKNAITKDHALSLLNELGKCRTDGTRVVILTGVEGNFSTGAQLSAGEMTNPAEYDITNVLRISYTNVVREIRNSDYLVISKVRGYAAGVGSNIALSADMVYAADNAIFSQIFTNIGLSVDGGGAFFLAKTIGYHKAFELLVNATKLSATEAAQMGLINHAVPEADLDQTVLEMAEKLANGPFVAFQSTKANLREAMRGTLESTMEEESRNQAVSLKTKDSIEGVMAFMQKRKPNWTGTKLP